MDKVTILLKKNQFEKLYLTGKYTQKEISHKIGVSEQSIVQWVSKLPIIGYLKIRENLMKELEKLSGKPAGHEDLIFRYIDALNTIETMIKRNKNMPKVPNI